VKAKIKKVKPKFTPINADITFTDSKEWEQFLFLVTLHPKEMNKILPPGLKFTKKEIEDYTWMDELQECISEGTT
jgi:hypothetical protein